MDDLLATGVTQTITVDDPAGRPGNCLQAAAATLLDLPLADVPHFLEHADWQEAMETFLNDRGYTVTLEGPERAPAFGLAFGPSPRGVQHATVYRDGREVWDPHPDRSGLVSVSTFVHLEVTRG